MRFETSNQLIEQITRISKEEKMDNYCESIYLVGSYSREEFDHLSDVDLIVIVHNESELPFVLELVKIIQEYIAPFDVMLDSKVYTELSFNDAKKGIDHFSIWLNIETGICILGNEIQVKLNPSLVISGLLHWIDRVEESIVILENHSQFEGSCFVLYSALVWIFFIEKYLLESNKTISKRETLNVYFGDMEPIVRVHYDRIVHKIRKESPNRYPKKLQFKEKKTWSDVYYSNLIQKARKILEYGNAVYRSLSAKYDV